MLILTIRTDKPVSEIGIYTDQAKLTYKTWEAHRALAETINEEIASLLQSIDKNLNDVEAIVIYKGPGSFTGLRIGHSVANALAYSLDIPVVAESDDWIEKGIEYLLSGKQSKRALPNYGSAAHVTAPKK